MPIKNLQPRLPAPVRLANALASGLSRRGVRGVSFDPEAMIATAARWTGLDDLGPRAEWREGLEIYARSLERDAQLHFAGKLHMRYVLHRCLVDRMRLESVRATLPPLTGAPLVVCGLPRSGTTFLHRMLCEAPDARGLPLWELAAPIPPPGRDRRRFIIRHQMARLLSLTPAPMDPIHVVRAELPDECAYLFKSVFRSSMQWQAPAYEWLAWHQSEPAFAAYREWRDWLRVLSKPGKRLVLKDPFHVGHLPALFAAVPQAMVVRTHRDPIETLPSFHKLTLNLQVALSASADAARIVDANTRWQLALAEAACARLPEPMRARVIDIDYSRIVREPIAVVRDIYRHFGLPLSEALEARLRAYVRANPQRKHGHNRYAAADFGQSEAELASRFAQYRETFGFHRAAAVGAAP